ncbi:MAG: sn-glycerol-3-phosphate ABC transporter permease UgpA [Anaerolineales bacterium]|nr:sn-glycerol-3-phosphate ABC transporter permease UgpA [Anaerolineales bacterium]
MQRRVVFNNRILPYFLLLPQLIITTIFFFWPASQAIYQSVLRQDPFGLRTTFVFLDNFRDVLSDPLYIEAFQVTIIFSISVTLFVMTLALLFAVMADRQIRGAQTYKTLLLWPYALAPAIAAVLWVFIFHPSIGIIGKSLNAGGLHWDYKLDGGQALLLIVVASSWKQIAHNFLFFLAGLQSVPIAVVEAAMIDGASAWKLFRTILFPLISPTTFYLLTINLVFAFFDTFGVIHALTGGGPGRSTTTLMYKVYMDGYVNLNLGISAAQSVILMLIVSALVWIQFRYVEGKVHYS